MLLSNTHTMSNATSHRPHRVQVVGLGAAQYGSFVLLSSGRVLCCGLNNCGQLALPVPDAKMEGAVFTVAELTPAQGLSNVQARSFLRT